MLCVVLLCVVLLCEVLRCYSRCVVSGMLFVVLFLAFKKLKILVSMNFILLLVAFIAGVSFLEFKELSVFFDFFCILW